MDAGLRERSGREDRGAHPAPGAAPGGELAAARQPLLRCAACGHPVTSAAARVERGGSGRHTFVNPHGLVFRIGCFREAPGAFAVGDPSTDWSWFAGYAWQVQLCRACRTHLGWLFLGAADRFSGLIEERLVEDDDGA